jgi:helicase required for RNAi-mediated heterochromatin assembly 1
MESWQAYVDGGAAADDAQYLQKSREEEARYLETMRNTTPNASASSKPARLIELSPEKKSVSKNADLLIDLDFGPALEMGQHQQSYVGAATYKGKGKGKGKVKTCPNYLD